MGTYDFKDKRDGKMWTQAFDNIAAVEKFLKVNRHIEWLPSGTVESKAVGMGDAIRLGVRHVDNEFNDRLKEIKKAHPLGDGINIR